MKVITARNIQKLIATTGIESFFDRLIAALEQDFRHWHDFRKSSRHATHYAQGVIELMPCASGRYYAFKYVNGHPGNTPLGKLSVIAIGQLSDALTGYPLLLADMTLLTAFRTAATSALAAKYLARPDAETLAIIGTGAQAEFQVLGFKRLFPLKEIRYYDKAPQAMAKFAHNLENSGFLLTPADSVRAAIRQADIVITATAAHGRQRLFGLQDLAPGTHLNAIGGDRPGKTELPAELLEAVKIAVEYLPQSLAEGEVQQCAADRVHAELWELTAGIKPGRESREEITLFDSVGFALEDYSALRLLYELASEHSLGEELEILPEPADPKDLFGLFNPNRAG
ncbi:ornithine cyclodeaminase [Candidatus Methylomicrobium oryzae]|jgi:ornithine cyclodeaminase|uniref:ornithine cyclodeaminase n=1 Tax=Candidatus Methylomicrobium oryzae TaxID=2802053 RepID=UPI0019240ADC|nr:ornithine cyclodeaminase [Methylomicrobium sp. RS1]MBL1264008.1 ornithine cyclodeaminase [Methylomicrobium sp. RS1]